MKKQMFMLSEVVSLFKLIGSLPQKKQLELLVSHNLVKKNPKHLQPSLMLINTSRL